MSGESFCGVRSGDLRSRDLRELGQVVAVNHDPEPGTAFLAEADDGCLPLSICKLLGDIPEADGGKALALLRFDEELRVERVGAGQLRVATG